MNIFGKKLSLLLLLVILLLAFAPSTTDCRGGRGGGGRSSGGRSSSFSSSSRSSYSYSSPSKSYSYSYTSVSLRAYYRPSYYYYSYTYNNYIYVGSYYGYDSAPVSAASVIIPIAIVGGIFLIFVFIILIAKCTDRTFCEVICCICFCQCKKSEKVDDE